ncbi:hypothetical protein [Polyangium fumosum]|uniref:Uncharacterized protein n=1 Tax=Polyangium fumosum TaxID=889272 RepID=A0A4U1J7A9_9BACT|nr:hypothetical protein [Polyangium fumosum]TKD03199.1 hypothetical protein E8A74_27190 [Polyangium fumosum]
MTTLDATRPAESAKQARSVYIAGPVYDWVFFLLPPIVSVLVGALVSGTWIATDRFWLAGKRVTWSTLLLGIVVNAHLVAVFVRSHLNPDVFSRHKIRFVVVPIAAFAAMMTSMWAVVIATVLVTFWDVYHSALQTFGLGRIYERNQGNDPTTLRRLDLGLNLLLYAGPIVSGATMLAHFQKFELFEDVGALFLTEIPTAMSAHQRPIAWAVIVGGGLFLVYYVVTYVRLARRGHVVSFPKVFLLATTGLCSIWAWGWNPFGQAFLIMNLFHAVQYFGLVWWSERRVLVQRLRLQQFRHGAPLAAAVFACVTLAYGAVAEITSDGSRALWSLVQTVALMHFFYDGFVWSVRKRQI